MRPTFPSPRRQCRAMAGSRPTATSGSWSTSLSRESLPTPTILGLLLVLAVVSSANPKAAASTQTAESHPAVPGEGFDPLVSAPGVSSSPLAGVYNPAAWSLSRGGLYLGWDDLVENEEGGRLDLDAGTPRSFCGALSLGSVGFAVTRKSLEDRDADHYDYVLGLSGGTRSTAAGLSYSWTRGAESVFGESERISLGSVRRSRVFSLGLVRTWDRGPREDFYQADLGVRPLGPRWTLFADARKEDDQDWEDLVYGFGGEFQILPGVAAALRYQPAGDGAAPGDSEEDLWSVRFEIAPLAGLRAGVRDHRRDGDRVATTYALELRDGPHLGQWLGGTDRYPEIELTGPVAYRTYRFFDDRERFAALLDRIARHAEDPTVEGVVIEMSGLGLSPAGLWEVRAQLAAMRARGKKVVLYFDRVGMSQYALATVADQIWMDPLGDLDLRGYHLGRTYYRRALEKVGIGFDELRFFTYKSAVETFSRTSLSEADKEQIGAFLDDVYEETLTTLVASRGMDRARWQGIIDDKAVLLPSEALAFGLVDSVGTFEEAKDAAPRAPRRPTGDPVAAALGSLHGDPIWGAEEWGEPPRIALLYAIGPCAMDSGIRGRQLSEAIRKVREDGRYHALVLRADSPGGDPLPSDLVARELRETARKKPVIVSQGQVAASGGYWISMYGDEILVTPATVTGSIGVIFAHVWDDSLGQRLGWDYEGLSRGSSADVQRGPALPLGGASIPHRPLRPEERARMEELIRALYGDFVESVAEGREMDPSAVASIAEGRIWSGLDGVEKGLADRIGGLWDALALAKERAEIAGDRPVRIEEGPSLGYLDLQGILPFSLGLAWPSIPRWSEEGLGAARGSVAGLGSRGVELWSGSVTDEIGDGSAVDGGDLDRGGRRPSALRLRVGDPLWGQLSAPDRMHLDVLGRHLDRPLVLAPPFWLCDWTEASPSLVAP